MKRLIAVILIAVMLGSLFPMSIVSNAESVTVSPYYVVNWGSAGDEITLEHIYGMPYTYFSASSITPESTEINITVGNTSDVKEVAQKIKQTLDMQPEGSRYINMAAMQGVLMGSVVDAVDMTHGAKLGADWSERFFSEYKRIGGKLDGIALDLEYFHASYYYLNYTHYKNGNGNKNIYNQIVANPVYQTRIRPKLVERGFVFYNNTNPSKYPERSEIWTVFPNDSQGGNSKSRIIWDEVIGELMAEYLEEACANPAWKYYPDLIISDYQSGDTYGWQKLMAHYGSNTYGNTTKVGNASNFNAYDSRPGYLFFGYPSDINRTNRTNYVKPTSFNEAVYPDSAYGKLLWALNDHVQMLVSTDTGLVNSWITFFNYGQHNNGYSNTPYYSELILHLGMITSGAFLGYIIQNEVLDKGLDDPNPNACEYDYNLQVVDDLMKELTRVAGTSDRKPIVLPKTWNGGYVLSGAYAGGRNIWRITPDTTKVSVADFKVKDKAPTFSVGGLTITFPQGRIIETGPIRETGNCGYWVETPANVSPVVTGSSDRYSQSPSFAETFDSYATGTFTSASVKPDTYWKVSGTASVQTSGNGNALSLKGDTVLTNTKVPQQITAGDSYAKQQVWEVAVTLPSGNYGDVQLLRYNETDGGIKISGGKVYYGQAGAYQELSGVSLSAGTYTVKRELNFAENSCAYSVYDASGNRLGGAEGVALAAVSVPVTEITMSCAGTNDAVLIDNYKLYPAGVAADFEIYDVITGLKEINVNASRTKDTAYRLSWMNASSQYKVAKIYNGSTLLKTVEMQPGTDGVEVAIVEASASNPAKLSVTVESGTAPSQPDYDNGNFGWNAVAYSLGIAGGPPAGSNNGDANQGGIDQGGTDQGGNNQGGTDQGGTNQGGTNQGGTNQGGTNQGGTDQGGTDQGGTNQGGNNQTPGIFQPDHQGLGGGVIALIVLGALVVLAACAAVVFRFAVMPKLTEESPAWLLALAKVFKGKSSQE